MTLLATGVVQVVGRLGAADPVAATARSWQDRLVRLGGAGDLVDPAGLAAGEATVVVHSADGGEALTPLLSRLDGRQVTLVHHGSALGSDRHVLRALRPHTRRALAADGAAREELRGLGYRDVRGFDPALAPMEPLDPDQAAVDALARHPAPRLLSVGPIAPNLGFEVLLDAFADLVTFAVPGAVLSLCGPSTPWYHRQLHRTITRRGLLACEVVEPAHDAEVVARLDAAACLIALRPASPDPYLRAAAERGLPIVTPRTASTAWLPAALLVAVAPVAARSALAASVAEALGRHAEDAAPPPGAVLHPADAARLDLELLRVLGLR